jgi:hypothetical protein
MIYCHYLPVLKNPVHSLKRMYPYVKICHFYFSDLPAIFRYYYRPGNGQYGVLQEYTG